MQTVSMPLIHLSVGYELPLSPAKIAPEFGSVRLAVSGKILSISFHIYVCEAGQPSSCVFSLLFAWYSLDLPVHQAWWSDGLSTVDVSSMFSGLFHEDRGSERKWDAKGDAVFMGLGSPDVF